jgi:hypothetical protein
MIGMSDSASSHFLDFIISPQPNETTCGPACLYSVYRFFGETISLDQVVNEVPYLEEGGTLAVLLANHALKRGYRATIYTYNLQLFDPTWFQSEAVDIQEKLADQLHYKKDLKLQLASRSYSEFLRLGGKLKLEDLQPNLIRHYLQRSIPVLTGLNSNFLYRTRREYGLPGIYDDVKGYPQGHFVVLCGYDNIKHEILVADPYESNPYSRDQKYMVKLDRLICSILLGAMTYDENLLIIEPTL